jgi:Flp pilus assembly protein TadG
MLRSRSRRSRGQSLVEFALVAPVLLALVGVALDFSRVYFTWINLESATRDAAQWVATDPGYTTTGGYYDSTDSANYCSAYPCTAAPSTDAKSVMDSEVGRSFSKSASQSSCTTPTLWASLSSPVTDSGGGSNAYPVAVATVTACLPFTPLFSYPLLTQNGTWVLRVERTFKVLVGR